MTEELNEAELALISRVKTEIGASRSKSKPAKLPAFSLKRLLPSRAKRTDVKRSLVPLGVGIIAIGLLISLVFIIAMQSVGEQLGAFGSFVGLSDQLAGTPEADALLSSAGFGWYSDFLGFYETRWVIAGLIFSGFTLMSALVFVIEIAKRGNK